VSLSLPVLNRAAAAVFLVSGAEKREALRRLLEADEPTASLPASAVHPAEGDLLVLCDRDAAGEPGAR
jgi:6-phosphogluconolactonase